MSGFTVITTMKNEGAFLLEWVAHHKALGFDHMLICTNDCADHTRRLVFRLQQLGLATHHATRPWAATSIQRSALKQATRYDIVRKADWVWVCDADEFLVVRAGDGSARALAAMAGQGAGVISVPWRVFGPGGRLAFEEGPVTRQFPLGQAAEPGTRPPPVYAKSLFRGYLPYGRIGIHLPRPRDGAPEFRREIPGGRPWPQGMNPMFTPADYSVAQVNHYALRSAESFGLKKGSRSAVAGKNRYTDAFFDRYNRNETTDESALLRAAEFDTVHARLRAIPGLMALHHLCCADYLARIAAKAGTDPQDDPRYRDQLRLAGGAG